MYTYTCNIGQYVQSSQSVEVVKIKCIIILCLCTYTRNNYYVVQVSENGYISMGEIPCSHSLSSSSSCSVVAPYSADINTEIAGTVRYTDFDTYSSSGTSMTSISAFIQSQTRDNFYGTRMMVAEWSGVSQYNGNHVSRNQRRTKIIYLNTLNLDVS